LPADSSDMALNHCDKCFTVMIVNPAGGAAEGICLLYIRLFGKPVFKKSSFFQNHHSPLFLTTNVVFDERRFDK
jgi:hypothetical protein